MSTDGQPHILAIGGGTFLPNARHGLDPSPLMRYAFDLTGQDRPRVCFVPTATGDPADRVARLYDVFGRMDAEVSHLSLFPMPNVEDVTAHLLSQDLIYVPGGSAANLLALWRLHGVDVALREAWEAGVVLAGQSAGALCWHSGGNTDSFGPELRPLDDGLRLLPYSFGVHYDSDPQRRPLLHRSIGDRTLPTGYAADEGVGLHYVGTEFVQAVSYRPRGMAWQIEFGGACGVKETPIEPRMLK